MRRIWVLVGLHLRHRVPTPRRPARRREYDDLFQEGVMALGRAAMSYDPQTDGPFAAYALPRIRGAVHTALHEHFATIRVPAASARQAARREAQESEREKNLFSVVELSPQAALKLTAAPAQVGEGETLRHALRGRYEQAVDCALRELRQRVWRQRNPLFIMERLARERLLVRGSEHQTSLRQIARETGVSCGRACDYERILGRTVRRYFENDPQVRLLVELAGREPAGLDALLQPEDCRRLEQESVRVFVERFLGLPRPEQARLLLEMIECSSVAVVEVACNLHRLTGIEPPLPLNTVA